MEKYCDTCKSHEEHRQLEPKEKDRLIRRTGRRKVDEFLVCTKPGCRNLRTGFDKRPFGDHIRLP
jgi:hypothetical protein